MINTSINTSLTRAFLTTIALIGLGVSMLGAGVTDSAWAPKVQVGQAAPEFTLTDIDGKEHTLSEYTSKGQIVVLEWFSPVCPFVKKHYRDDTMTMINIEKDFKDQSVVWLRMNSARAGHPASNIETNKKAIEKWGITTPILMDPKGTVGRIYGAKRTPEMYIIDATGTLVYHGAIDDRNDGQSPGGVNFVRTGLTELIAGEEITAATTKAYGCTIKY